MFAGFETKDIQTTGTSIRARVGGSGPPLLLLHGFPQTHVIWHKIAPALAERFTVVAADLRGYGDSGKPPSNVTHMPHSKRAMAQDQVEVMRELGFRRFCVAGHDRGGRVAHRMALDHPERVDRLAVLDIVPTHKIFSTVTKDLAIGYYHWFFLIQDNDLPETLIGHDPVYYLMSKLNHWGADPDAFTDEALEAYVRAFCNPEAIHAACEDYRAGASIDLEHDEADLATKIACPLLALWGEKGLMDRLYDILETWRERASDVRGRGLNCGHFLPEEAPEETLAELLAFFDV